MEITYSEFCELLELSAEEITEFADWSTRYMLRTGVNINECRFKLGGWWWGWDIFTNEKQRADFEKVVSEGENQLSRIGVWK